MEINSTLTAFRNVLTRVRKAIFDSRAYWLSFLLPVFLRHTVLPGVGVSGAVFWYPWQ